jgi:glycosyltransferase involved in cell wall biosynthesis
MTSVKYASALEDYPNSPAVSFYKWQFILPDRYNLKSRLVLAVNKAKFGDRIKFNGGGDLCQPTLDGKDLDLNEIPQSGVPFYNYEKMTKTKAQIRSDAERMENAYQQRFGRDLYSYDKRDAYQGLIDMMVGRFNKPQKQISRWISTRSISKIPSFAYGLSSGAMAASDYYHIIIMRRVKIMLKVVCVVDKEKTALDRLAQGVKPYHDNIDYTVVAVHPKRPDPEQLEAFERAAIDADVIDWQYFRTAELLRKHYPWLESKKQILTHNNPYSVEEQDWAGYDLLVGNNQYIYKRLGEISTAPLEHIPITVDTDFWTFNPDWSPTDPKKNNDPGSIIMVANRIEGKKGVLPVAIAAAELGLKFILVGAISDQEYFFSIQQTGNVEFHEQVTDEELRDLYYRSTIHVCNSVDNFESGTMPVLEAMLCGTPVLSRLVGHVPELSNGSNMVLHEGDPEDVE